MANISVSFSRSILNDKLGINGSDLFDEFLSDIGKLNASDLSTQSGVGLVFTPSGAVIDDDFVFTAPSGFDFNEVINSDWGSELIRIFEKHNIYVRS